MSAAVKTTTLFLCDKILLIVDNTIFFNQVILYGVRGQDWSSDAAIDELQISEGQCQILCKPSANLACLLIYIVVIFTCY